MSLQTRVARHLPVLILLSALLGFLDATYLTVKHYVGGSLPCSILDGCDTVTTSTYATIGPVPVALLGALFYLTIILLVVAYWQSSSNIKLISIIFWLSLVALIASLYFIYLQIFVIKALCLYCLISATTSTLIFFLTLWWRRGARREVLTT